jgi:DNA-binding NarL/FixJ family response regulator
MNGYTMNVLIVDDSPQVRRSLARLLGTLRGVTVAGEAGSVWEAIEMAARTKPDAVILDIRLPGGDGFEVLRAIKKEQQAPLVLMLTNYASESYRQKSLREGADYFFDKSTEFENMLEVLKAAQM